MKITAATSASGRRLQVARSSQKTSGAMRMRTTVMAFGRFQFADGSRLPAEEVISPA